MTRDYIKSACRSHYHVIATIEIRKRSVELIDGYSRDPVGCTRGHLKLMTAHSQASMTPGGTRRSMRIPLRTKAAYSGPGASGHTEPSRAAAFFFILLSLGTSPPLILDQWWFALLSQ